MKKYLLFILVITVVCYAGCKKEQGGNNAPPSADSYMPVTAGTTWTYADAQEDSNDTITVKMNNANTKVNGKTYYTANTTSKYTGANAIYFYEANHVYATRNFNNYANAILELQLYNDTATLNTSWTSYPSDDSTVDKIPVRAISTIEEKGETKVFGGKTYINVVHTEVDIQFNYSGSYSTTYIYDYYLGKGIGILGYNLRALGDVVETEGIVSYTVK